MPRATTGRVSSAETTSLRSSIGSGSLRGSSAR